MALPEPVTRKEMYLNKAATGSGSIPPKPVTREEMYLEQIANGGGGGPGLPAGGTAGQFLVKQSSADGDAAWVSLSTWQGGSY